MVSFSFVLLKLMKKYQICSSINALFLNKKIKYMQLAPYCDLESHDSLYFSMHLRDVLIMNTYIQTRFQKSWDTVQIVNKNRMQ